MRHLGPDYLDLLRFYLNHKVLERSQHEHRTGKTPAELLTGKAQRHWLDARVTAVWLGSVISPDDWFAVDRQSHR